jgi:hypothetical protein
MTISRRALLAAAMGAALLISPTAAMAARPVKPPPCTVSAGVIVDSVKVKGVTTIYVTGTAGTDVIDCSAARSRVVAHGVAGGGTGDTIYGGPKDDDLYVENASAGQTDYAVGNGGNDTIHAGGGSAVALAMGDDFNPSAVGGGVDTLIATGGFVQFYGGDGNDLLDVSAATGSLVEGNAGNDVILGSPGHDSLYGGAGDDTLTDASGNTEIFDCGDGAADVLNDLDGNGTGGWTGDPEDDTHSGCETVNANATPPCSFTPGTSGCVVLRNVVAYAGGTGPAWTALSGTFEFSPITTWDFFTGGTASGSGTWASSTGISGTWAARDQTNTQLYFPSFSDESGPTTCTAATTRYVGVELTLAGGGLASDAIMELSLRVATTGINGIVYQAFSATSTGEPMGLHQGTDASGITIRC